VAERFRNRYRVGSTRLLGFDYSRKGMYFVTICTRKKIPFFGDISDNKMNLSDVGIIVNDYWLEIQSQFLETIIDEFIIMPDHIHRIIMINPIMKGNPDPLQIETPILGDSKGAKSGNTYWKAHSLGSIINQFKRICTLKTREAGLDLVWQPRYYDHIIRSINELENTRQYIRGNVKNWNSENSLNFL